MNICDLPFNGSKTLRTRIISTTAKAGIQTVEQLECYEYSMWHGIDALRFHPNFGCKSREELQRAVRVFKGQAIGHQESQPAPQPYYEFCH